MKPAIAICLLVLYGALALYNGLYVFKIDWGLYFLIDQSCVVISWIICTMYMKTWLKLGSGVFFVLSCVELYDEIRKHNLNVTFSDYSIPVLVILTLTGIILMRRYKQRKRYDHV